MGVKRVLARALVSAVALAGCGVAIASQASPALAASCYYTSCTGKNPQTTGCSTTAGNPLWSKTYDGYGGPQSQTLQLRRSSGCRAYWARGIRDDCAYPVYTYLRVEQQLWTPYGYYDERNQYKQMNVTCNGGTDWTNMIQDDNDDRTQVCIHDSPSGPVNPANVPQSDWACSGWF
jgi:Protein of unknown function (DUF2690)